MSGSNDRIRIRAESEVQRGHWAVEVEVDSKSCPTHLPARPPSQPQSVPCPLTTSPPLPPLTHLRCQE